MKRLFVLRHGQAGHSFTGDDHSRTLTSQGQEQARQVGGWLAGRQEWPEAARVSDAMRTRQTCVWIDHVLGDKAVTPYLDHRLYLAQASSLCSVINETPDSVRSLLVIGHMPGIQDVSMALASADSDERAVLDMAENWPPAGLAVFAVEAPWSELDGRDARLEDFVTFT